MFAVLKLLMRGRRPASSAPAESRPPRAVESDDRSTLPMDSWATSSMDLRDGMQIVELHEPPGDDGARPH
jgi:hypothetical protein